MSATGNDESWERNESGWRAFLPVAPLHPIAVHFSIALTAASFVFDALARIRNDSTLAHAGWWTLAFSAAVTLLTIATGLISRAGLVLGEGRARGFLRAHMALGFVFLGVLLPLAAWRWVVWSSGRVPGLLYLAALAAVNGVMLVQGYLGGELVYRWGADVQGGHATLRQQSSSTPPPSAPWLRRGAQSRTSRD